MHGTVNLPDGRLLEWADNGIVSTEALFLQPATTIALDVWGAWFQAAAALGIRIVAINRPGVGASTRNRGRRITDDVADAEELVRQLGLTKFVAIGWSGGGGRAIGMTFIEQCVGAHTIACIPWQDPNDELWMAAVTPERLELTNASRTSFEELLKRRSASFEEDQKVTAEEMLQVFPTFLPNFSQYPDEYKRFAVNFSASIRRALMNGPEADGDDYAANIHLWGFRLEDVTKPVTLWHGTLDDDVEFFYGEYNHRRIPGSKLIPLEGLGHIDIVVEARDQILSGAIDLLNSSRKLG